MDLGVPGLVFGGVLLSWSIRRRGESAMDVKVPPWCDFKTFLAMVGHEGGHLLGSLLGAVSLSFSPGGEGVQDLKMRVLFC